MTILSKEQSIAPAERSVALSRGGLLTGLARRLLFAKLRQLEHGRIDLICGDEEYAFGAVDAVCPLRVELRIADEAAYTAMVFGGSIGAAEAYMLGQWSSDDLTGLMRIMVLNRSVLDGMESGVARLFSLVPRAYHWLNRNTRSGSKRNIVAHYDLSDAFFRLFLDPTLCYSSACFERSEMTLEEASTAKMERLCRKLALSADDHLLEIGSGWGGMALHAARHYGCRVTTTTISDNQYRTCLERVRAAGLEERITVLRQDYRDLTGTYTKLVSIEMIEAIGWQYYETYFESCSRLLAPDGIAAIQAITIDDRQFESAKRSVDFIQRYIFPGSNIPSVAALTDAASRAGDLRLFHQEALTPHYARTLREWRERFFASLDDVRELGFSERFIRMWEYYLCYCEGGFAERAIGVVQMVWTKPLCRREPILGTLS